MAKQQQSEQGDRCTRGRRVPTVPAGNPQHRRLALDLCIPWPVPCLASSGSGVAVWSLGTGQRIGAVVSSRRTVVWGLLVACAVSGQCRADVHQVSCVQDAFPPRDRTGLGEEAPVSSTARGR